MDHFNLVLSTRGNLNSMSMDIHTEAMQSSLSWIAVDEAARACSRALQAVVHNSMFDTSALSDQGSNLVTKTTGCCIDLPMLPKVCVWD